MQSLQRSMLPLQVVFCSLVFAVGCTQRSEPTATPSDDADAAQQSTEQGAGVHSEHQQEAAETPGDIGLRNL